MADYDRRPHQRGFYNNNRKRRYRDDDDYDRRPQRRRYEEPVAVKVRKQILSIAESPIRPVEEDVASIGKLLAENFFDNDLTTAFNDLVVQLTLDQPLKIPFVAAIVLVVNAHRQEFTEEILKKLGDTLQSSLNNGQWRNVKLLLRCLACLQALFEGDGVFTVLEELFLRAVDLQTASSEDALGLELVKVILAVIPYAMASSATGLEKHASSLLDQTEIIALTPHTLENLVDCYATREVTEETQSTIALLQKCLQAEAQRGWELSCLPRPWKVKQENENGEDILQVAAKHAFPEVRVPSTVEVGPNPIYPEVYFSVYAEQDMETVPPVTDLSAFLLRDVLTDTINGLDFNRMATAKFLIDVDCYFAPNTFVKRATAFDKLKDLAAERTTWKPEDVAVDAAFSLLFQLPAPEHKLVYYHSVLTEACKIAPAAIAPSLGRAIRFLYKKAEKLDLDLSQRFLDWFAHHLSNFGFTWKWTEWVEDVELPDVHPRKAFIVAALDKEMRLSFAQRIKGTLPDPYKVLIPESREKDMPDFKYADPTTPFSTEGAQLATLIRQKAPDTEIAPRLESIQHQVSTQSTESDPLLISTDAYVTAISYVGSKSLSHMLSCIERCKDRLLSIGAQSPAARRQILSSVFDYWRDQPGVAVNIIDKLLNYTILTPRCVVEWALQDRLDGGKALAQAYAYEMVSNTTTKVTKRVEQIVRAVRRPGLPEDQVEMLKETLERERGEMKTLFAEIEDALVGVADGGVMAEVGLEGEEGEMVKSWAVRWLRVFRRKLAVEEGWIAEELAKPVPPAPMEDIKMDQEEGQGTKANGSMSVNANGYAAGDLKLESDGIDKVE
ncbi:MAG: hypothetical protein Q9227_006340 [Pyrenula ochraceoflavens]